MLIDIYVLASERSNEIFDLFINSWMRGFIEVADEYEFPQYSEKPQAVYSTYKKLVNKLMDAPQEPHSIYWRAPNKDIVKGGMVFFTSDCAMIVGVSIDSTDMKQISRYLKKIADTVGGSAGYCAFEEPPPETVKEFLDAVMLSNYPKLIDGQIVKDCIKKLW